MNETPDNQQVPSEKEVILRFPYRLKVAISRVENEKKLHAMTGIPIRTIQDWVAGKTEPKISRIAQVAIACGVSLNWLITGTGEMEFDKSSNWGTTQVPKFAISASAGHGSLIDFEDVIETIPMSTVKLHRLNIQPSLAFYINVTGDSMEPKIPNGAMVLAERIIEYQHHLHGIYIFRLDDELFINIWKEDTNFLKQ